MLLLLPTLMPAQPESRLSQPLGGLAREARAFANVAPNVIGRETLVQRALLPQRQDRVRSGSAAQRPEPRHQTRKIVSQYGFSTLAAAPGDLQEFREVEQVDGRAVASRKEARRRLYLGMRGGNDRVKNRMLEDFQKFGLQGAVTGLGQLILLFTEDRLDRYRFEQAGDERVGAQKAQVIRFRQKEGAQGLTIFENNQVKRFRLEGRLWLRKPDGVPLRIELVTSRTAKDTPIEDRATVEYEMSRHGCVLPASAAHVQTVGRLTAVEDSFRYDDFRLAGAGTGVTSDLGPSAGEGQTAPPAPPSTPPL